MSGKDALVQGRLFKLSSRPGETWARVPGWSRYWVSTHGRVYSESSIAGSSGGRHGGVMKPRGQGGGYQQVGLFRDGEETPRTVHSLVMEAHGPPPPESDYVINHIDGDRSNNRIENLEYVTRSENYLHGLLRSHVKKHGYASTKEKVKDWLEQIKSDS